MTDPAQPEYLGRQDDLPRTLSSVEPFATLRGDHVSKHSENPYASRQLSSHYDHPLWQHASHVDTGFFGSVDSVEQLHRTFSRPGKSRVRLIPGTEGKQGKKSTLPVLTVVTLASPFNVSMKFETSRNPMIECVLRFSCLHISDSIHLHRPPGSSALSRASSGESSE